MERTVQVVVVGPPNAPSTECDEAIARALTEDARDQASDGSKLPEPSAPPLPQLLPLLPPPPPPPPMAPSPSAGEQQVGQPGGREHSPLEAVSRYDEQLARELQEEELQHLSAEERERLASLPRLLRESPLARALSERLASLAGVSFAKLIPRVNSGALPAATEAASAPPLPEEPSGRPLLEQRLRLFCLVERVVKGDGACQFRSLSDQLYRSEKLHAFVRERVCQQLRERADWYRGHVPGDYQRYCDDMAGRSTWGDHVTLQAAADAFEVRIWVLTSYEGAAFLEIEPRQRANSRVLLLSFFAEIHYNSLYYADDPPPPPPGAKLLGSRRLHALLLGV